MCKNKNIIERVIKRAIDNGFKYKGSKILCVDPIYNAVKELQYIGLNIDINGTSDRSQRNWVRVSISDLLFSLEFMKALTGEDKYCAIKREKIIISRAGGNATTPMGRRCPNGPKHEICLECREIRPANIYHMSRVATIRLDQERMAYMEQFI